MKKKIFIRSMLGFPFGVTIGYMITILNSFIWAEGSYYPCVPELTALMGSEINAVLLQAVLCGVLGMGFTGSSVIWEMEDWGLAKQTGIYFLITAVIMMPIAYVARWMEHSVRGISIYFGIFVVIFVVIWAVQYLIIKHNVKKLNESLYQRPDNHKELR